MNVKLTLGAVEALFKGSEVNNPVLQLLNIRDVANRSGPRRYRLMMSDGQHYLSSFLLATQLNNLPEENLLAPHCVCKLKRTKTTTLTDGRTLVIVLDMEIVQTAEEAGGKIGNPIPYNKEGKTSSPQESASTSTSVPASPPSAVVSGPSYENNSRCRSPPRGSGRGLEGNSPTKASPSKFSPTKGSNTSPGSSTKFIPIAQLNPYQSKWTIRARVTNKSSVRNWSNSRGEGKLFSFEIADESGEMRITAFNNEVDKFFPLLEQGKVYYISKGTLKVANKQYTTLRNDYEMTLHAHSSIVPCDDSQDVPAVHCDFVPIAELENRELDTIIDLIGVCKSAEDVSRVVTKTSREVSKRALHLIDATGKGVAVTLWGEEAEKFDGSGQPVVAIKGARLSDFRGRSLSLLFSSTVMVNPDIPEAFRLRAWAEETCPPSCVCARDSGTVTCRDGEDTDVPRDIPEWATTFTLKGRNISTLQRGAFSVNGTESAMATLCLSYNGIQAIEPYAFLGLPRLRALDLSHNQLTSISARAFHGLLELRSLCLNDSIWPPATTQLSNALSSRSLRHLHRLELAGNSLKSIPLARFDIYDLHALVLMNNSIESIGWENVTNLFQQRRMHVYLSFNPFRCNCELEPFYHWLKNSSQCPDAGRLLCSEPESKRGLPLESLHREDVDCMKENLEAVSFVFLGVVMALIGVVFLMVLYLNRGGIKRWLNNIREACRDQMEVYQYRYEQDSDPRLANVAV